MSDPLNETADTPKDRILDAASSEFAALGFSGARINQIAERAGVNKAMLYYHIGDKQALYTAVLMRNFDRVSDHLANAQAGGGSPRQRLERMIVAVNAAVRDNPDHPRIVLNEVASGAVNLPDDVLARMLEIVEMVRCLLDEGVASGEVRHTDPLLTHLAIVGAVIFLNAIAPLRDRATVIARGATIPEPLPNIGLFIADLMLHGLTADAANGVDP